MDFDLAVLGSGFGGSLTALVARRCGLSVVLLERGRHPRFAIGESSTPLANLLLEEISDAYGLPRVRPLSKWGSWQRTYPDIGCGLKRGFSFFHHRWGEAWVEEPERGNQLLVTASPNNDLADTHWYRPDFDHFLAREAAAAGVEYLDETELRAISFGSGSASLAIERSGGASRSIRARFVIDATGPRGALHRLLGLSELAMPNLPGTQAVFSHFKGVHPLESLGIPPDAMGTPYPVDDAAVHHVFDGGWIWVLRFNNGLTSAGVAARDQCANRWRFREGATSWDRLLEQLPSVRQQFNEAEAVRAFTFVPRLSFCSERITGPGWALLPSAAGFVDPLLSTGFTLTLLGVLRLGNAMREAWGCEEFESRLSEYSRQTREEFMTVERLVAALYATMGNFPSFSQLSRLYFAPVSYSEIARRLGLGHLADSFLLHAHPEFGFRARRCLETALDGAKKNAALDEDALAVRIAEAIAPFDLIGLSDATRHNWYGCHREDLLRAAPKLSLTEAQMDQRLRALT